MKRARLAGTLGGTHESAQLPRCGAEYRLARGLSPSSYRHEWLARDVVVGLADGGPYAYARAAFGNPLGFANAWSYWITAWAGNAAAAKDGLFPERFSG